MYDDKNVKIFTLLGMIEVEPPPLPLFPFEGVKLKVPLVTGSEQLFPLKILFPWFPSILTPK